MSQASIGRRRDAPKLGPPLPGDLGRPILKAQQQMANEAGPPAGKVVDKAALRQQRLAELKAARESGLMVQVRASDAAKAITETPPPLTSVAAASPPDQGSQSRKEQFAARGDQGGDVNANPLVPAVSPYMVAAGSVISASLITGLNSDLPGMVTAQVTQNLFDTAPAGYCSCPKARG